MKQKVTGATKLLKAHLKNRSFFIGYCKHAQTKYITSYKSSLG